MPDPTLRRTDSDAGFAAVARRVREESAHPVRALREITPGHVMAELAEVAHA
ncbi:hypothetical protein [Tritonibacter sp. SIMBA_163]|uniref:hypothetical protein n=1 Tax=Tritonibacter sp. SIMBA_163 TaxID=3080868 RepID=UPI00397F35E7